MGNTSDMNVYVCACVSLVNSLCLCIEREGCIGVTEARGYVQMLFFSFAFFGAGQSTNLNVKVEKIICLPFTVWLGQ